MGGNHGDIRIHPQEKQCWCFSCFFRVTPGDVITCVFRRLGEICIPKDGNGKIYMKIVF